MVSLVTVAESNFYNLSQSATHHFFSNFVQYAARWLLILPIGHLVMIRKTMNAKAHMRAIPIILI